MNNLTTPQREHLYRGKRLDNGEWIEGSLIHEPIRSSSEYSIYVRGESKGFDQFGQPLIGVGKYRVDPATIGQYINRNCDKTGARIFEGMEVEFSEPSSIYPADRAKKIGIIVFSDCSFVIEDRNGFRHYRWMDYHVEIFNQPQG